jgi:telomerase Cajal body protein 1
METVNPVSCAFASSAKSNPVRLWDAFNGSIRASYTAVDSHGQMPSAYGLQFSPLGDILAAGYEDGLRFFHTATPNSGDELHLSGCRSRSRREISGAHGQDLPRGPYLTVACQDTSAQVWFAGNGAGTLACCDVRQHNAVFVLSRPSFAKGIHAVHSFSLSSSSSSSSSPLVVIGARHSDSITVMDMRNISQEVKLFSRSAQTPQKLQLSPVDNHRFVAGDIEGNVYLYDLRDMSSTLIAGGGANVNARPIAAVDFWAEGSLLAVGEGCWRPNAIESDNDSDDSDGDESAVAAESESYNVSRCVVYHLPG